jgi:hypothetical protein
VTHDEIRREAEEILRWAGSSSAQEVRNDRLRDLIHAGLLAPALRAERDEWVRAEAKAMAECFALRERIAPVVKAAARAAATPSYSRDEHHACLDAAWVLVALRGPENQ